jgi:hypothetical protein
VRPPDFDDLVGNDLEADERARLRRAHDALLAAGPPAELPTTLRHAPGTPEARADVRVLRRYYPPRRLIPAILAAAAIAAVGFGVGYLIGTPNDAGTVTARRQVEQVVKLRGPTHPDAIAVVEVDTADDIGNRPMTIVVEGLPQLSGGDYYTLFMTKHGKLVVPCGTFNVEGGEHRTAVRLTVAYDVDKFDGFALAEYSATTHKDHVIMRAPLEA